MMTLWDGGCLLRALHILMAVDTVVHDGDKGLGSAQLASVSLPWQRHNFQNLILQGHLQEKVNGLRLLDGQKAKQYLLQGLGLHVLNQQAQSGDREMFLILSLTSLSTSTSNTAMPTPCI